MQRFVWQLLFLGGLLAWALVPSDLGAQSKAKRGKDMVEIDGAKSAVFDHWKKEKTDDDKSVLYKFDLGKPKDMEKSDPATMTIMKVTGTEQEIFSNQKQLIKDDKATVRGPDEEKYGKLKAKKLYMVGTPSDKKERYRLIAYLFDTKDGKVLVRVWGPSQLMGIHTPNIDDFLKDFK
jgi:hypothetical protein